MSWPRIRFWQSIDYTRGIVSGRGWLAAGVRCEVTDSTLNCLNVGQGQWFLWSLRERAECIYTTVSKSATGKNWNKEEMRNKKSSLSYLLLDRESLNFEASFTHSPFPVFMQIKENVIHWGQWRARCITASYIETVKYFEQIIMGFTSCICASIGRRKIKGAIIGMF